MILQGLAGLPLGEQSGIRIALNGGDGRDPDVDTGQAGTATRTSSATTAATTRAHGNVRFPQGLQQQRAERGQHEGQARHAHPGDQRPERALRLREGQPSPGESAVRPVLEIASRAVHRPPSVSGSSNNRPSVPGHSRGMNRQARAMSTQPAAKNTDCRPARASQGTGPR